MYNFSMVSSFLLSILFYVSSLYSFSLSSFSLYLFLSLYAEPLLPSSPWWHPTSSHLQILITFSFRGQITSNKAQTSSFSIIYKAHQSELAETSSNGRIIEETKLILLHHHHCHGTSGDPPAPIPPSVSSPRSFVNSVFLRWSVSEVLFPILKSCHSWP